jgi:cation:H+ antiporter
MADRSFRLGKGGTDIVGVDRGRRPESGAVDDDRSSTRYAWPGCATVSTGVPGSLVGVDDRQWGHIVVVESLLAVVGLVLLTVAAEHLVLGSSRVAARLRVSPVVVGVVVIGLGTSAPEFLVSGVAAARGNSGIAVGNIVGSNILNLTLILGVASAIRAVRVSSTVIRREVRLAVVSVVLFAIVAWIGLTVPTGLVLAAATIGALWLLVRWARDGRNRELAQEAMTFAETPAVVDAPMKPSRLPSWVEPIRALIGLAGVLLGAELLVTNASAIATRLGVSQVVIGLTLVALGTSVPELVTTIAAQRHGESDLVVGNLFGSNLFNSLAGGAVIGLAAGSSTTVRAGSVALLTAMIFSAVLAWALLRRGLRLTRPEAVVLLAVWLICLPLVLAA